jgi:hypothetical protein
MELPRDVKQQQPGIKRERERERGNNMKEKGDWYSWNR